MPGWCEKSSKKILNFQKCVLVCVHDEKFMNINDARYGFLILEKKKKISLLSSPLLVSSIDNCFAWLGVCVRARAALLYVCHGVCAWESRTRWVSSPGLLFIDAMGF